MAYLLDSNVFIQAKNYHFKFAVCPGFWTWIDRAFAEEKVFSVQSVYDELLEKQDELTDWVKERPLMFMGTDDAETFESLSILSEWAKSKYKEEHSLHFFDSAEYSLIGYAHAYKHTVVTHEVAANGHKVKVPNACGAMGVPCITPYEMLSDLGARFVLV